MPSVALAETSLLATPSGWKPAAQIGSSNEMFGIDRYGQWALQKVELAPSGEGFSVYLGTESTFAVVSDETCVLLRDGTWCSGADLVDRGQIRERSFETVFKNPVIDSEQDATDVLWQALSQSAGLFRIGTVALRCLDVMQPLIKNVGTVVEEGNQRFLLLSKSQLRNGVCKKGIKAVCDVLQVASTTGEAGEVTIHRDCTWLLMNYRQSLIELGQGFCLRYDSIQHTLFVHAARASLLPLPITLGACACRSHEKCMTMTLAWRETSWSPVSGGFILHRS